LIEQVLAPASIAAAGNDRGNFLPKLSTKGDLIFGQALRPLLSSLPRGAAGGIDEAARRHHHIRTWSDLRRIATTRKKVLKSRYTPQAADRRPR
jgi:hypothetical protein